MAERVRLSLVALPPGPARTAAVERLVSAFAPASHRVAVVLDGARADGGPEPAAGPGGKRHILAAGCPCCVGALPLRVTLARLLRLERPEAVVLTVSDPQHRAALVDLFSAPPWSERIVLAPENETAP